jgi:hypothetical protein
MLYVAIAIFISPLIVIAILLVLRRRIERDAKDRR